MSVIQDVLKDEYNRLNSLVELYDQKISEYPKGSMSVKKRGHQSYCYQVFRDHHQIKFHYVGKQGSPEAKRFSAQIEKRRGYEAKRRESKDRLSEVSKLLRVAI